jgi:hypothetical protein
MSTHSFLPLLGSTTQRELWVPTDWLPRQEALISALQLRVDEALSVKDNGMGTTMRQGLGLVLGSGLLAGSLPFLVNWFVAARAGTALPLVRAANELQQQAERMESTPLPLHVWAETANAIAGMTPRLPGWLAAGLSAFGQWLNLPINWLTLWLVYGLAVLIVAKLLGATTTLPRFYAATSYGFAPLTLTLLSPIPCIGWLASLVALAWTLLVYIHAVQITTALGTGKAILATILPAVVLALISLVMLGKLLTSLITAVYS